MADTAKTARPRKTAANSTNTTAAPIAASGGAAATTSAAPPTRRDEAKSRFNTALEEARAGAALLGAEARERAGAYGVQARERSDDWTTEAKTKASELASEGKTRATEAISSLGRVVGENAATLDERFGTQYGDYARSASKSLQSTATRLEQKSVDQIGEDAREFVRRARPPPSASPRSPASCSRECFAGDTTGGCRYRPARAGRYRHAGTCRRGAAGRRPGRS